MINSNVSHGILLGVALVAAAVLGVWVGMGSAVGTTATPFEGKTADGTEVRLSDHQGKIVVLDFWATWCPPCVEKIPSVMAAQEKFRDRGVQVIGISGDMCKDDVREFEQKHQVNFPTIVKGADQISQAYGVQAFPTIVIIDRSGRIALKEHHPNLEKELEKLF